MNTLVRLCIAVALLAALGYAGYRLLGHDGGPVPAPPTATTVEGDGSDRPPTIGELPAVTEAVEGVEDEADPTRTAVDDSATAGGSAQGVQGSLIDADGRPIHDAEVFLLEGVGKDLVRQMMLAQRGITPPPIARTTTDPLGRFSLPVRKPIPGREYEVRAIHDRHADANVQGIRLTAGDWYDTGAVRMPRGNRVEGRVTVAGSSGLPIAGATVYAQVVENLGSPTATPGRELGIETTTDNAGNFRFENVKSSIVNLAAVAPGFAKVHKFGQPIGPKNENRFAFELPPGLSIAGVLTDPDGDPIPRAKVGATSISSKTPVVEEARTDQDGRFEIFGLVDGPYRLVAFASGFVHAEIAPIQAGAVEQHIVLEPQCRAFARVTAKNGRAVRSYQLALRKHFQGRDHIGSSPAHPAQLVTARDVDAEGWFAVENVDPGSYVFEIEAKGYAKTFSEPFVVETAADAVRVEITLAAGGRIRGIVTDESGSPLGDVTVTTLPNYLDRTPLTALFGSMMPPRITRTSAKTGSDGGFLFDRLAAGTYQLEFAHPDRYTVQRKDIEVRDEQVTRLDDLVMQRGTRVFGHVECDGKPAPHVHVTVASIPDAAAIEADPKSEAATRRYSGDAITDANGDFELTTRLPPGRYQTQAARQTLGQAMMKVLDFAATRREFDLAAGQDGFRLDFTIPATTLPPTSPRDLGR